MRKVITSDQRDLIEKIDALGLNRVVKRSSRKIAMKHTGTGSIVYASNITKKDPENEIFVNVACSSYEIYGCNSNGDGFPSEKAYPGLGISKKDLLGNHYKTFEKGKVYSMHDMTVPIGIVHKAFWNNVFKWVELVVEVFADKLDEETLGKIRSGEMIFFSMGCDVAYDVCTICGHHSYGNNYCKHIKDELLHVIDDKVAGMLNPSPLFDDISIVFIPADAIAVSLYRKTASGDKKTSGFIDVISRKAAKACDRKNTTAKLKKVAEIYKDTRSLKAIDRVKEAYGGLTEALDKGLSYDNIEEVFSFFFSNRLPLPVLGIMDKYSIDSRNFIKAQEAVIDSILKDIELRTLFEEASEGMNPNNLGKITAIINTIPELDPKARALSVFNIINKLGLSDNGIDKKYLPKDSPEVKDIKTVVRLEFLGGRNGHSQ